MRATLSSTFQQCGHGHGGGWCPSPCPLFHLQILRPHRYRLRERGRGGGDLVAYQGSGSIPNQSRGLGHVLPPQLPWRSCTSSPVPPAHAVTTGVSTGASKSTSGGPRLKARDRTRHRANTLLCCLPLPLPTLLTPVHSSTRQGNNQSQHLPRRLNANSSTRVCASVHSQTRPQNNGLV